MTAPRKAVGMTVADFQAWQPEEHPERRWQLFDGEPVSMVPATENHGRIQAEAAFLLGFTCASGGRGATWWSRRGWCRASARPSTTASPTSG